MAENFYTILTLIGKSKLANSTVLGNKVNLKTLQVGDGNGTYHEPSEDQTSLINKVWESDISSISVDEANSNWIVIQTIIPATDGGFYIREAGIFDEEGDLIAVSKVSETYKPVISEGSAKDVAISIVLEVSNVDNITLNIDPNIVVATKNDIEVLGLEIENFNTRLSDLTSDQIYYCGTTSGTNTYTVINDKITAYAPGLTVRVMIGATSTGASTLNINGFGAVTILDSIGNTIISGGLKAGLPYQLCYNDTNFIILGKGGGGSATAAQIAKGATATVDSGLVTGTLDLSQLTSANIKSGITINGVSGSQTVVDTTDAVLDPQYLLTGYSGYDDGVKKNGTMPSHEQEPCIATGLNALGTVYLKPAQGYWSGDGNCWVYAYDANFITTNIVSGKNIFGLAGSASIESLGGRRYASGEFYIGSGNTACNIGFTPKTVILKSSGSFYEIVTCSSEISNYNHVWAGTSTSTVNVTLSLTATGFIAGGYLNTAWTYIAIG